MGMILWSLVRQPLLLVETMPNRRNGSEQHYNWPWLDSNILTIFPSSPLSAIFS